MYWLVVIGIAMYMIAQGRIEHKIWSDETGEKGFWDYHSLRFFEQVGIYLALVGAGFNWIDTAAWTWIFNVPYEMMNKGSWNISDERVTFNIFGRDLPYRWYWMYVWLPMVMAIILIWR